MYYPEYVYIFYNWYLDNWWLNESKCAKNPSEAKKLERVVSRSLVVDHAPRIEDQDADKPNVGNIVSNRAYKNKDHNIAIFYLVITFVRLHNLRKTRNRPFCKIHALVKCNSYIATNSTYLKDVDNTCLPKSILQITHYNIFI